LKRARDLAPISQPKKSKQKIYVRFLKRITIPSLALMNRFHSRMGKKVNFALIAVFGKVTKDQKAHF
jgi:hypothetical protein